MKVLRIVSFVLVLIAGALNLITGDIGRLDYGILLAIFILEFITNILNERLCKAREDLAMKAIKVSLSILGDLSERNPPDEMEQKQ